MKNAMKSLCYILLTSLIILVNNNAFSQDESSANSKFQVSIRNITRSSDNSIEFDLFLLNLDKNVPLEMALFQAGIKVNPEIYNGGTITASIVPASSELIEDQQPKIVLFSQTENAIKIPSRMMKTPHAKPGSGPRGSIIAVKKSGTRICRIKLDNTRAFLKTQELFSFSFEKLPYSTAVYQYIDGVNTAMNCSAANCVIIP